MEISNTVVDQSALGGAGGCIYYNYVIASDPTQQGIVYNATTTTIDSLQASSSSSNQLQLSEQQQIFYMHETMPSGEMSTTASTTLLTSAQQQYPMLVQQCIENDDAAAAATELEPVSQATLNVVLTTIDTEQQQQQLEQQMEEPQRFVQQVPASANDSIASTTSTAIVEDGIPHYYILNGTGDEEDLDEEIDEEFDEDEDHCDFGDEEMNDGEAEPSQNTAYESEQELTSLAWLSDPLRCSAMNVLATAVGCLDDGPPAQQLMPKPKQQAVTQTEVPQPSPAPAPKTKEVAKTMATKSRSVRSAKVDECLRQVVNDKNVTQERFNKFMLQVQQSQTIYTGNEVAYRALASEKPPFNYAQIIAMAMMECGRMTLKDICTWIRDRFAYYRTLDNWNNSIRHNLSLHFCFTKIARDKTEKGKGGYWELAMNVTKGEKKRVRNRSKRALAAAAAAAAAAGGKSMAGSPTKEMKKARRAVRSSTTTPAQQIPADSGMMKTTLHATEIAASQAAELAASGDQICGVLQEMNFAQIPANVLNDNEILLGCDIPLSGDCIIIPYNQSQQLVQQQHQPQMSSLSLNIPTSTPTSPTSMSSASSSLQSMQDSTAVAMAPPEYSGDVNDLTAATLIAHGLTYQLGPNVIVEPMPYGGANGEENGEGDLSTQQSVFDQVGDIERQLSSMVQLQELVEYDVYDYTW